MKIFTENEIRKIKTNTLSMYQFKAIDARDSDLFVTKCYISAILIELEKKGMLKVPTETKGEV